VGRTFLATELSEGSSEDELARDIMDPIKIEGSSEDELSWDSINPVKTEDSSEDELNWENINPVKTEDSREDEFGAPVKKTKITSLARLVRPVKNTEASSPALPSRPVEETNVSFLAHSSGRKTAVAIDSGMVTPVLRRSSRVDRGNRAKATKSVVQIPATTYDLPKMLAIPCEDGTTMFKCIDEAPEGLRRELLRLFESTFVARRMSVFNSFQRNPRNHQHRTRCVRDYILVPGDGRLAKYEQGGAFGESACDRCIHAGKLCTCLAQFNNEYRRNIVPLPAHLRVGKTWEELGYWVPE
jgi:hypothetical protein